MSRSTIAGRVARSSSALAVLTLVAAVAAVAYVGPTPTWSPVPAATIDVPPSATTLVCPGPVIPPDPDALAGGDYDATPVDPVSWRWLAVTPGAGPTVSPAHVLDLDAAATPGRVAGVAIQGGWRSVVPPGPVGAGTLAERSAGPTIVRAEPADAVPSRVAGATTDVVTAGDLRGLSAASCQRPAAERWLVGGATTLGTTTQLVLTNPGGTPAEVTVAMWGPSGPVEVAGAATYLLAPGAERVVRLDALAAEERRVVTRVTSAGGQVTAHLQVAELRGLTPAGVDVVVPATSPALRQVVTGLDLAASTVDDPDAAVIRVLAPGQVDGEPAAAPGEVVTVTLSLLGPQGPVELPGAEQVELEPGVVTDVSLGGVPAGVYSVVVQGDAPVLAGGSYTRRGTAPAGEGEAPVERAWVAATALTPLGDGLPVPGVTSALVTLTAPGEAATGTLRAYGADGALLRERPVEVRAGSTTTIPVADLGGGTRVASVDLTPATGELAWALVMRHTLPGGEGISVLTPAAEPAQVAHVEVTRSGRLGLP